MSRSRPALVVLLACVAQFMLLVDDTITNVALPTIGRDLHFSVANLSWVVNAYLLTFGGFLLLGGRMADLLGRRRKRGLLRCGRGRHRRKFDHDGAKRLSRRSHFAPSHHRRHDGAMHKRHDRSADRPAAQTSAVCDGECHYGPDAFSNPTSATLR